VIRCFKIRTWMWEAGFVWLCLSTTTLLTKGGFVDWLATVAIWISFLYTSICDRLGELEKPPSEGSKAFRVAQRLLQLREALWFLYFWMVGSYSVLVGVMLFLLYPLWRRFYRNLYPRDRNDCIKS
jgi:hypothetical protein